jgi:hypothetical protein
MPFVAFTGLERFELFADEDFALQSIAENDCGSEAQEIRLLELTGETIATQRTHNWIVEPGCESEFGRLPDATCATTIEGVLYLEEVCAPPCEIRGTVVDAPMCVCE